LVSPHNGFPLSALTNLAPIEALPFRRCRSSASPTSSARTAPPDRTPWRCRRATATTTVDFTDALPRNPSGKILKKDLRAPYWKGRTRQVT
jgi:acyl-CoA synthetase (AMP-forming)/AMP-acid ligase II